jgi:hypothetical protein
VSTGPEVVSAAIAAGFRGDALLTIVAIAKRESGWDAEAQGDLGIQTGEWGPSVGLFQIRTLHAQDHTGGDRDLYALIPGATAGQPGSGKGDLLRQAAAAWTISSAGTNFAPWSTFRGLSDADKAAAQAALDGMSPTDLANAEKGKTTHLAGSSDSGIFGDAGGALADAMNNALGDVLGFDGSFTDWAAMVAVRSLEVIGGGLILSAGAIVFLDVVSQGRARTPAARGGGIVARSVRKGVALGRTAVTVAAL